jgi:hypothetical protein
MNEWSGSGGNGSVKPAHGGIGSAAKIRWTMGLKDIGFLVHFLVVEVARCF